MFFKKLLFFSFVFCFSFASYAEGNIFSESKCINYMKKHYPDLLRGNPDFDWQKQGMFFRCLHDTLEIFVDKEIFIPPEDRNHFIKQDIINLFELYFEYDPETSRDLTNKLFFIKRILIGGSVNELKVRELATLRRLVYDYEKIYYILHKQIPVFRKAFAGKRITPQERTDALNQLQKAFTLLKQAYIRENIVYPIHDIHQYDEYLEESHILNTADANSAEQPFWFLHNLYEGLFSPNNSIRGQNWLTALDSLYNMVDLFLYHKAFFSKNMFMPEFVYKVLEGMEILVSSLQLVKSQQNKRGFPLKNLDEMLSVALSYQSSHNSSGFFTNINQTHAIPLFTRTLTCFSLDSSPDKKCKSEWGSRSSSPVVTLSFEDDKFELFPDKIERSPLSSQSAVIELEKLSILKRWLADYRTSIWDIYSGNVNSVASNRRFDHWLNPLFGWEEENSRITFGSFHLDEENSRIIFGSSHPPENTDKPYQLLNYQAFLPLLFASYLPEAFFSPENGEQASLPSATWQKIIREVSPALVTWGGKEGYKASWKDSFSDLFHFADLFSYSSNRDELLNARELVDLTIHLLEGIKSSYLTYNKVSQLCADNLNSSCASQKIVEDEEIMAAYPRLQRSSSRKEDEYKEKIEAVLEEPIQALSFTTLFILLQVMEIHYDLIDTNQSLRWESNEILFFAKQFEELAEKIPHLSNTYQARAYLIYRLKTGDMPFFTGDAFTAYDFVNWYFDSEKHEVFEASPNDFRFLVFDFYKLYQNF